MSEQAGRSYRWLFWALVLVGFAADQASKYGVFGWLYEEALDNPPSLTASRELIPDAFHLSVGFTGVADPSEGVLGALRTWGGEVQPHVNKGALFGWGNSAEPGKDHNTHFLVISLLAAVGIGVWSTRPSFARDRGMCMALGLILAGTLGNLLDRVVFGGVRDFLDFHLAFLSRPDLHWPTFNVADVCLVCGAGLLLLHALRERAPAGAEKAPAAGETLAPQAERQAS
jgi:lipoprotein signal peptidase